MTPLVSGTRLLRNAETTNHACHEPVKSVRIKKAGLVMSILICIRPISQKFGLLVSMHITNMTRTLTSVLV